MSKFPWFTGPLLFLVGLSTAVIALEGFLRVHNPFPFAVSSGSLTLPANRTYRYKYGGKTSTLKINSLGFRGPELPHDSENLIKIVAVGGSTTECRSLDETETWPYHLSKILSEQVPDLWLNNAGFSGHSTHSHQLLVEDHLRSLQPDLVLLLVGINEMCRDDLVSEESHRWHRLWDDPVRNSHLVQTVLNLYRMFRVIEMDPGRTNFHLHSLAPYNTPQISSDRILETTRSHYLPPYRNRLQKLVSAVQSIGATPVFITQPLLYGPHTDPTTGIDLSDLKLTGTNYDATNQSCYPDPISSGTYWADLELYNSVTRETAHSEGLPLIELAHKLPKDSKYFSDSMHFTAQGAQEVAIIISKPLLLQIRR